MTESQGRRVALLRLNELVLAGLEAHNIISLRPATDDLMKWEFTVKGPVRKVGFFRLDLQPHDCL